MSKTKFMTHSLTDYQTPNAAIFDYVVTDRQHELLLHEYFQHVLQLPYLQHNLSVRFQV